MDFEKRTQCNLRSSSLVVKWNSTWMETWYGSERADETKTDPERLVLPMLLGSFFSLPVFGFVKGNSDGFFSPEILVGFHFA